MVGERGGEPRLADAGIAEDEMNAAPRVARVRKGIGELSELPRPSDQRPLARRELCRGHAFLSL